MNRPIKFIDNGKAKVLFLGSDGRRGTWLLETLRFAKIGASQLSLLSFFIMVDIGIAVYDPY